MHAYFITFSCYRGRRLLDLKKAKRIVTHYLRKQLKNQGGSCIGFVIMPDHVHAMVQFEQDNLLSVFMNQWKRRSSIKLKKLYRDVLVSYNQNLDIICPMWQPRYYAFNVLSNSKAIEKLSYIHNNPVNYGLVRRPTDWSFSSARWYATKQSVGVPITPILE